MAKKHTRLQRLRVSQSSACFKVCFQQIRTRPTGDLIKTCQKEELLGHGADEYCTDSAKSVAEIGNRIMVVVDSSFGGKGALEWALSHAVQNQDSIILLHVAKSSKQGVVFDEMLDMKVYQLLLCMKNMCQMRRPGVKVEMEFLQGKEMGRVIVEEAKKQRVSLLVLGQRKQSPFWSLVKKFSTNKRRSHGGIVEYCIQNSSCPTIAVRRKSKKLGGYLITTKSHKNFWLLA
ncbi:uncharacterized protein LOC111465801 [Cucurbita maxima]|uniref:Uncharacterized protein LOC111465801 n=1 Tax=Cucurbita maxima TaxID=3661 RepID=A0A6J1HM19_CUCMA|nr:uncharacterized protein LOC111465801 [Cucurbita maxima]